VGAAGSIGRPVRRREDARILSGRSRFVDDVAAAGAVQLAFVRSPHAFARVLSVSGAFVAGADLVGQVVPAPVAAPEGMAVAAVPQPVLADGEVRYAGQPVAAVVGETRALAEDAAERVSVAYAPGACVLDPRAGPEVARWERRAGDVSGAFAGAAHVVRVEHVLPGAVASALEPRGVLVVPDRDRVTVYASVQSAHRARAQLAQMLDLPEAAIRVVVGDVGGGFGAKATLPVEAAVAVLAALELRRPVKWIESRLAAPAARGLRAAVELALDASGRVLGLRARLLADLGAYLLPNSAFGAHATAMLLAGAYDVPAVEAVVVGARTNKAPAGPSRGAGAAEAAFLIESALDAAARRLDVDPVALRRRNLVRRFPHRTALGWTYDSGDFERCLDTALALADVAPSAPGVLAGTGVSLCVTRSGGLAEHAAVARGADGRVEVRAGSIPSGKGQRTVLAQIAADRLGVDVDRVTVLTGDTDALAEGVGSFTSRSTVMGGSAVAAAAEDLAAGGPGVARFASEQVFGCVACVAVVHVVRATGAVRVVRVVAVDDAGVVVNPLLAEGQLVGGALHGLGAALGEAVAYDEAGRPPTSPPDRPIVVPEVETAFVATPSPLNPLGLKGVAEAGAIATPAAIANALADVLGGIRLDPPFTAEKVWQALQ